MGNLAGRALLGGAIALVLIAGGPNVVYAAETGPTLTTPEPTLRAALHCGDLTQGGGAPVLLVHSTTSTAEESWSWGYARELPRQGHPACAIDLPDRGLGDAQIAAEYVVYAVRHMHRVSDRKVSIVGHSQGGMDALWALQHWPDLPGMVDDVVGMASPYHGTELANIACDVLNGCPAGIWQLRRGSAFVGALIAGGLPAGPSYTSLHSLFDEVAFPQPESSHLAGASNIIIQDRCPGRLVEHLTVVIDAVYFAYVIDALDHAGPALLERVPWTTCLALTMPGVDYIQFVTTVPKITIGLFSVFGTKVPAEPVLIQY
jgi:pimeloyl-ACP methyl ester carboxylesterase